MITKVITKNEERIFDSDPLTQIEEVSRFLNNYNPCSMGYCGITKIEHPSYPKFAIKECLVNALSYGDELVITILEDSITFTNIIKENLEIKELLLTNRLAKFKEKGLKEINDLFYGHKLPTINKTDDTFSITLYSKQKY